MHLIDEEDYGDSMVVPQTLSEEIKTRIDISSSEEIKNRTDISSNAPGTSYFAATHFGGVTPSPDYVPGLEHPPLPDYVPEPEYPEYLVPSPGYVADSDPKEDPEEDPKEDLVDYPADGGDDDDDDDDEEEDNEDSEEDEEKEEHLALADTTILPAIDPVPLAEDT
nr:hypothetical protein [Tanacetum cinerariifolium]